jgi:hypothetical protein
MIAGHLQDRTFARWALDPTDAVAVAHLNQCDVCRKEAVDFRGQISAFREALLATGEGRRLEWTAPAPGVSVVRHISVPLAILTWAPRLVLATLVLAFAILVYRPRPAPPPVQTGLDDQALMLSVEEDLNRSAPQALAPADIGWSETKDMTGSNQKAEH